MQRFLLGLALSACAAATTPEPRVLDLRSLAEDDGREDTFAVCRNLIDGCRGTRLAAEEPTLSSSGTGTPDPEWDTESTATPAQP